MLQANQKRLDHIQVCLKINKDLNHSKRIIKNIHNILHNKEHLRM